jgi:hypothetical protein
MMHYNSWNAHAKLKEDRKYEVSSRTQGKRAQKRRNPFSTAFLFNNVIMYN